MRQYIVRSQCVTYPVVKQDWRHREY